MKFYDISEKERNTIHLGHAVFKIAVKQFLARNIEEKTLDIENLGGRIEANNSLSFA